MIPLFDTNKLTPVTCQDDTAPAGQKTMFQFRMLTLTQRAEIEVAREECGTKTERECLDLVVSMLSYFVARIDDAGIAVDYEEREFAGRQVRCVARAWIDEHVPFVVLRDLIRQAIKLHGLTPSSGEGLGASSETAPPH